VAASVADRHEVAWLQVFRAGLRASPQHAVGHFSERLDAEWTFARWWLAEKFRRQSLIERG
jgi:hypothetical protein